MFGPGARYWPAVHAIITATLMPDLALYLFWAAFVGTELVAHIWVKLCVLMMWEIELSTCGVTVPPSERLHPATCED